MNIIDKKQLLSLCIGEFMASISFIFCYFTFNVMLSFVFKIYFNWVDHVVFVTLILTLWQGAYFWMCLYHKVKFCNKELKAKGFFRILRIANVIILAINTYIIFRYAVHPLFNTIVMVFTVIEYINYYYIRLSYPLKGYMRRIITLRFSKARMLKELAN